MLRSQVQGDCARMSASAGSVMSDAHGTDRVHMLRGDRFSLS